MRKNKDIKRLSAPMEKGLVRLMDGTADFQELYRAGCSGVTSATLVKHGLASKRTVDGQNRWSITEVGKVAYASGYFHPKTAEPVAAES